MTKGKSKEEYEAGDNLAIEKREDGQMQEKSFLFGDLRSIRSKKARASLAAAAAAHAKS